MIAVTIAGPFEVQQRPCEKGPQKGEVVFKVKLFVQLWRSIMLVFVGDAESGLSLNVCHGSSLGCFLS
jgi:hypothetical protein